MKAFLVYLLIFNFLSAYASASSIANNTDYQWQQKRNQHGIKIYTSKVANSKHKAILGTIVLNTDINSVIALLQDPSSCAQWIDLCKKSRIEKQSSTVDYYLYTYTKVPFPVKDRDIVAHITWQQDPDTLTVTMGGRAVTGITETTHAVRVQKAYSQWRLTPLKDQKVLVEVFIHVDPNRLIPA